MTNKQQGRYLNEGHIKCFKKGIFKKILEGVKEDPELTLEIRRDNETMVYYHKDKILTTRFKAGKPSVEALDKKYYEGKEKPKTQIEELNNLRSLTYIREYFKEAKQFVNQWKAYKNKLGEEFIYQQNIALGNQSFDGKYIVVDMEWQLSQENLEKRIPKTRFDLVIVDTEKNSDGYNDIYLAELKVGTAATKNDSGIIDHIEKTEKIINYDIARNALVNDVQSIIKAKKELGLYQGDEKDFNFSPDVKPKMMLILFYRGLKEKKQLSKDEEEAYTKAHELGIGFMSKMIDTLIKL